MGSSTVQGKLWGARPHDFAEFAEQVRLPLMGAALDAAHVTRGTRLLDAGCGAGLGALLASLRGATVTALRCLAGAARRGPGAAARCRRSARATWRSSLSPMPASTRSWRSTASSSPRTWRRRCGSSCASCARAGGSWSPPGGRRSAASSRVRHFPAPAAGAPAAARRTVPRAGPRRPGRPGGAPVAGGATGPGEGEVACPFVFPNAEAAFRANASAGPNQIAIAHSGEAAVRAVYAEIDQAHTRPDGSIRYENVFLWAAGERP